MTRCSLHVLHVHQTLTRTSVRTAYSTANTYTASIQKIDTNVKTVIKLHILSVFINFHQFENHLNNRADEQNRICSQKNFADICLTRLLFKITVVYRKGRHTVPFFIARFYQVLDRTSDRTRHLITNSVNNCTNFISFTA